MRLGQNINKQLNQLQTSKDPNQINHMSITSKQSEAVTLLDVHVQTTNEPVMGSEMGPETATVKQSSATQQYFRSLANPPPQAIPNFQRTRLNHIMSLSQ